MPMKRLTLTMVLFAFVLPLIGQNKVPALLNDMQVRIESTEGINDMYNFRFERADAQFRWLKKKYDGHPLPYFLLGLSQWWRIVPHIENEIYDNDFLAYMDSSLVLAEGLFNQGNQVEGAFFISASYAFKGRLHSERRNWRKAASEGKNAMKYLEYCRDHPEFGPEIMFGDAIYNYYAEWIPENYPILKPVMMFFKDGDKDLGVKQLKEVANNAFFTRTEAQYFLMRILANEENKPYDAVHMARYLLHTFPNNPYFHRFYTRLLYTTGQHDQVIKEAESILDRIDSAFVGYEYTSGRYAAFFLGEVYKRRKQFDKAKKYYKLSIEFGDEVGAQKKGYYLYSVLSLGSIAWRNEDEKLARKYFKRVKKLAKRKHPAFKQASDYLKEMG